MSKTRKQKEESVVLLTDKLRKMRSIIFANYEGLPVKDIEELRRELKKETVEYTVVKKTLLGRAAKLAGLEFDPKAISGNFATAISYGDEIAAAKVMAKFAKEHEALKMVGGVLEGKMISAALALSLAKLPGRMELLGSLVGTLQAPISGLMNVLTGNMRELLGVLSAIKDKKTA